MSISITPVDGGSFGYSSSREYTLERVSHSEHDFDDEWIIQTRVSDMQTLQGVCNQRCHVVCSDGSTFRLRGEFYLPDPEIVDEPRTRRMTARDHAMGTLVNIHLHNGPVDESNPTVASEST